MTSMDSVFFFCFHLSLLTNALRTVRLSCPGAPDIAYFYALVQPSQWKRTPLSLNVTHLLSSLDGLQSSFRSGVQTIHSIFV